MSRKSLTHTEILTRVQNLFAEALKVPIERVTPEARLKEDLTVDSLFISELALALEDEFDIIVDDAEMPHLTTVESVVHYVSQTIGEE